MHKLYFTLAFSFSLVALVAQQAPQQSLYMLNKYSYNPAYAGFDNSLSITGMFRAQWVGLEGAPSTQIINAHMPLYYLGGGLGINLENDELGAERNASASISYNYMLPVSRTSTFSIGIAAGVTQKSLDGTKLRAPQGLYSDQNIIDHQDDLLPLGTTSAIAPLINVGVYFHNERFEAGLSTTNVSEPSAQLDGANAVTEITFVRNYFANFAATFEIGSALVLQPSLLLKSDMVETQVEISTIARYSDNIFGGASFRGYNSNSFDAVVLLAGYKLSENLTLAYAYDITISDLSQVSRGSHEVMLNYNLNKAFGKGRLPKIIYNPRFL